MRTVAIFLAILSCAGCEDFGIELPPAVPIAQLFQAPDTISVDGKQLYPTTALGRDFFPISPPDGRPLVAVITLTTADSSQFPASASADALWIVYNNQIWKSYFTSEPIGDRLQRPYQYARIAREGPKWGPFVFVDVVVRVYDSHGNAQLLHAPHQWIGRSD